jgi:hypothetical protein
VSETVVDKSTSAAGKCAYTCALSATSQSTDCGADASATCNDRYRFSSRSTITLAHIPAFVGRFHVAAYDPRPSLNSSILGGVVGNVARRGDTINAIRCRRIRSGLILCIGVRCITGRVRGWLTLNRLTINRLPGGIVILWDSLSVRRGELGFEKALAVVSGFLAQPAAAISASKAKQPIRIPFLILGSTVMPLLRNETVEEVLPFLKLCSSLWPIGCT